MTFSPAGILRIRKRIPLRPTFRGQAGRREGKILSGDGQAFVLGFAALSPTYGYGS